MRLIKLLVFWAFILSVSLYGKAQLLSHKAEIAQKVSAKEKIFLKITKGFSEGKQNKSPILKRKIKSRGVEVGVPQISSLSFQQVCSYNDFLPSPVQNTNSSFLYCVDRKRGPPAA